MLTQMKHKIRHIFGKRRKPRRPVPRDIPPALQHIGEPERPADPVMPSERRHDGWGEIRPRRPGEDTDMNLRPPDITMPGKGLRPVEVDDDEDE